MHAAIEEAEVPAGREAEVRDEASDEEEDAFLHAPSTQIFPSRAQLRSSKSTSPLFAEQWYSMRTF